MRNATSRRTGVPGQTDNGQRTADRSSWAGVKYDSGSNKKLGSIKKQPLRELHANWHIKICNVPGQRANLVIFFQTLEACLSRWHAFHHHMPASIEVAQKGWR